MSPRPPIHASTPSDQRITARSSALQREKTWARARPTGSLQNMRQSRSQGAGGGGGWHALYHRPTRRGRSGPRSTAACELGQRREGGGGRPPLCTRAEAQTTGTAERSPSARLTEPYLCCGTRVPVGSTHTRSTLSDQWSAASQRPATRKYWGAGLSYLPGMEGTGRRGGGKVGGRVKAVTGPPVTHQSNRAGAPTTTGKVTIPV